VATVAVSRSPVAPLKQNWILGSWADAFFIIGTPVFVLPAILLLFFTGGELLVWSTFAVVNTSHHLPTFLRIYGDRDLLSRFRWSLLLAPIIPFTCCMAAVVFLIRSGSSMNNLLYLYTIVTVWDLWHFLMQHYGFMRIYDRHNRAPRKIASRMDLCLCGSWFIYIMLATVAWLPTLLYQLAIDCGVPLLNFLDSGFLAGCQWLALGIAVLVTARYCFYLRWCRRNAYFISYAKIALMVVTFGMMYLTYVPHGAMDWFIEQLTTTFNALFQARVRLVDGQVSYARGFNPGGAQWTLLSGFATLGIVHVTQYLAIVWKYNRNLAQRKQSVRAGIFQWFFSRGQGVSLAAVIGGYLVLCMAYGYVVTMGPGNPVQPEVPYDWLVGLLASILFASTITHYYFDGFIWKVRHKENRQNLEMEESADPASEKTVSWWDRSGTLSPLKAISWQAVYFLPPIILLSGCYWVTQQQTVRDPAYQLRAVLKSAQVAPGVFEVTSAQQERASSLVENIDRQLVIETRMMDLFPQKRHKTYAAHLTYWKSVGRISLLEQGWDNVAEVRRHLHQVDQARKMYVESMALPGSFAHREELELTENDIEQTVREFEEQIRNLIRMIDSMQGPLPGDD